MMDENMDQVMRITREYVERYVRGEHPQISVYIARYPHYAAELADFFAYFHVVEEPVLNQEEAVEPQPLSATAKEALKRVTGETGEYDRPVQSMRILPRARNGAISVDALARALNLGTDVLMLLEQRMLVAESLPEELLRQLATLLQQSVETIRNALRDPVQVQVRERTSWRRVAEESSAYLTGPGYTAGRKSFRQAVEESDIMISAQKAFWYTILQEERKDLQDGIDA